MKTGNILLILAGVAVAAAAFFTHRAVAMLNFALKGVAFRWEGAAPVLRFKVSVQNVSNESFQVKSVVGTLRANGFVVGNVSTFTPVVVPPASAAEMEIDVRMSLIGVVSDIVNVIEQGSGPSQELEFTGNVNASGIVQPLELKYKIL